MNRGKVALALTGVGWLSAFVAVVVSFASGGAEALQNGLFFGPLAGFFLHGAAVVVAGVALLRPQGTLSRRPAVLALLFGGIGLVGAFGFATFWVAVASNGGA